MIAYHLLLDPTVTFRELGPATFDRHDADVTKRRLVERLTRLGFDVALSPKAA